MIKLSRHTAPPILTAQYVMRGVDKFLQDGSAVWNVDEIKSELCVMSHGKCAYCEVRLGVGATYVEIEHFLAKQHHPHKVLDWDNLLPACRRCNATKSDWDVAAPGQMIIDPTKMDPKAHIKLDPAYRPVGRTKEGETTIIEIGLDDITRLGVERYKLGEKFKRKLEELHETYISLPDTATVRARRSVIRKIRAAVELCDRHQPFSAVTCTVLMSSSHFEALKMAMRDRGEWDDQLQSSHESAAELSLA